MRPIEIDNALRALAAPTHGVFRRRDAAAAGVDHRSLRRRLAAGTLREPVPGVLVDVRVPATWRQDLAVGTLAGSGGAASHRAAIGLHLPEVIAEPPPEVLVRRSQTVTVPGVVVHRSDAVRPSDLVVVDGIRCTNLAVSLALLGSVAPELLEPALDAARRSGVSLRRLEKTAARLHRPGQRGTGLLRELLREIEPGERVRDSWFEKLVEEVLRSPLLPPFTRQHEVRDRNGRLVARLDGAFPGIRLGVEAHSRRFHFGSGPESRDEARDLALAGVGWEVVYLGWHRTRSNPDDVLRQVFATAVARGWDPVAQRVGPPRPAA